MPANEIAEKRSQLCLNYIKHSPINTCN